MKSIRKILSFLLCAALLFSAGTSSALTLKSSNVSPKERLKTSYGARAVTPKMLEKIESRLDALPKNAAAKGVRGSAVVGVASSGYLSSGNQSDLWSISVTKPSLVSVTSAAGMSNMIVGMLAFDSDDQLYPISALPDSNFTVGQERYLFAFLEPGVYCLAFLYSGSSGQYAFKYETVALPSDESEPNDDYGQSQPVKLGQTMYGMMSSTDRYDGYHMAFSKPGTLKICLDVSYPYATCGLYDADDVDYDHFDGYTGANIANYRRITLDSKVVANKTYFFDVINYAINDEDSRVLSNVNFTGPYELTVEFTPDQRPAVADRVLAVQKGKTTIMPQLYGYDGYWTYMDPSPYIAFDQSRRITGLNYGVVRAYFTVTGYADAGYIGYPGDDMTIGDTYDVDIQVRSKKQMVTSVKVSPSSLSLKVGGVKRVKATVSPKSGLDKAVYWRSMDTSVATVDAYGFVTAQGPGKTTIVATTSSMKTKSVKVTVKW